MQRALGRVFTAVKFLVYVALAYVTAGVSTYLIDERRSKDRAPSPSKPDQTI
ncbi:MAG: hypothetical protein AAF909_09190 [Pseudomonadota bacterium]